MAGIIKAGIVTAHAKLTLLELARIFHFLHMGEPTCLRSKKRQSQAFQDAMDDSPAQHPPRDGWHRFKGT